MKLRFILNARTIMIASVLIFWNFDVFSQISSEEKWKHPGLFLGCSGDLKNSQILNKEIQSISNILSDEKISGFGSMEIGYFFSKYFGLTSGINYNTYSSKLSVDSYLNQYNTVDSENESYEMRISGKNIAENQQVEILNIPLSINFRVPVNMNVGFFLQTGINLSLPMDNKFESSGIFTYKGYFPAYNVILENLPDYGFPTNLNIKTDGELELEPLIYGASVSAGIDYLINKRVQLTLAAFYDRSISDITNYSSVDEFNLITDSGHFNSILSGSSKTALQSIALKLAIRYYFSDYTKFKYYYRPSNKQYLRENVRQKRNGFSR